MKASEVLKRYQEGARSFKGVNLSGQSFKRKNLSGADFTGADLRSANFSGAILKNAKFCGAKAGLNKLWAFSLFIVSCIMMALSGVCLGWTGALVALIFDHSSLDTQTTGSASLFLLVVFSVAAFRQGIGASFSVLAIAGSVAIVVAGVIPGAGASVGTSAGAVALALAVAITDSVAEAVALAVAGIIGGVSAFLSIIVGVVVGSIFVAGSFSGNIASIGFAVLLALFSAFLGWRALKGDPRDAWIRSIAIFIATTRGTSFKDANLTNADFTGATLKSTDLRAEFLTHTRFEGVRKLDFALLGETILAQPAVRELLVTLKGERKDYTKANLRGANLNEAQLNNAILQDADLSNATLQKAELESANLTKANLRGANLNEANLNNAILKYADLSEATLQKANLKDANLREVDAAETDFTEANMTGICIEAWNITSHTKLANVDCQYIFLLEKSNDYGSRERRPHDSKKNFELGEFTKLYQKSLETVDLIFQHGIDWKAFLVSFNQLQVEQGDQLTVQAIENKKDGAFVIRVEVPPDADKAETEASFWQKYKPILEAKDKEISAVAISRS